MVDQLSSNDFGLVNGILRTAHSLFKRYAWQYSFVTLLHLCSIWKVAIHSQCQFIHLPYLIVYKMLPSQQLLKIYPSSYIKKSWGCPETLILSPMLNIVGYNFSSDLTCLYNNIYSSETIITTTGIVISIIITQILTDNVCINWSIMFKCLNTLLETTEEIKGK